MPSSGTVTAGNPILAAEYNNLRKDDVQSQLDYYGAGGSSNAFTITADTQYGGAYVLGSKFRVKANHTITGPATLNVSTIGAVAIKLPNGDALIPGDIINGQIFDVEYDGTNFQLTSPRATELVGFFATLGETVAANDQISLVAGVAEKLRRQKISTLGTTANIDAGNNPHLDSCKLSETKVLAGWFSADDARYELAVLSIDPTTLAITEGTNDQSLTDNGSNNFIRVAPLGTDKAVVFYMNSSSNVMAVVATITGTTIALGTPQQVNTTGTITALDVCQVDTDKCAFVYATATTIYYRVATVSGTVFTFGTEATDASVTFTGHIRVCKSAAADITAAYKHSSAMVIRHYSFSGTTLTNEGAVNAGNNPSTLPFGLCSHATDRVMVIYETSTGSDSYIATADVSGAPSIIANRQWDSSESYGSAVERIAENRCLITTIQGSSPFKTYQIEVIVDGVNPVVQYDEKVELDDADAQGDAASLVTLLDETIDGEVRVMHVYNSMIGGTAHTVEAVGVAEYNNYNEFKGIAANAGNLSDQVFIVTKGKLTGSGFTANQEVFADPAGFTPSIRPFKVGHTPSTTILEVNIERHSYSVMESRSLSLSTNPTGNGILRMHHDLLVKPTSCEIFATSSGSAGSIGFAGTDGNGGSYDEANALSSNVIETVATAPAVDQYDDRWIDFDVTPGAATSLNVRVVLHA